MTACTTNVNTNARAHTCSSNRCSSAFLVFSSACLAWRSTRLACSWCMCTMACACVSGAAHGVERPREHAGCRQQSSAATRAEGACHQAGRPVPHQGCGWRTRTPSPARPAGARAPTHLVLVLLDLAQRGIQVHQRLHALLHHGITPAGAPQQPRVCRQPASASASAGAVAAPRRVPWAAAPRGFWHAGACATTPAPPAPHSPPSPPLPRALPRAPLTAPTPHPPPFPHTPLTPAAPPWPRCRPGPPGSRRA